MQAPERRESQLRQAIWSPLDATAIDLNGSFSPGSETNSYDLRLNLGLANVSLQPLEGRWNGQIEVKILERKNSGTAREALSEAFALNIRQENYEKTLKTGLVYSRSLKIDPEADSVRVIVRDPKSGNLGTLTIPLPKTAQ